MPIDGMLRIEALPLNSGFNNSDQDEIGRLIETRNPFRAAGFAKADSGAAQHFFDRGFERVADQLTHRIAVSGERTTEESLVKQHGVRRAHRGQILQRAQAARGIGFLQAMDGADGCRGTAFHQ